MLSEGGPSLVADLIHEGVLDELFLTTSPALYGRFPNDGRKSLTNGLDLAGVPLELLSLRRHDVLPVLSLRPARPGRDG